MPNCYQVVSASRVNGDKMFCFKGAFLVTNARTSNKQIFGVYDHAVSYDYKALRLAGL